MCLFDIHVYIYTLFYVHVFLLALWQILFTFLYVHVFPYYNLKGMVVCERGSEDFF